MPVTPPNTSDTATRLRAAGCVFAEDEARLIHSTAHTGTELDEMIARRASGIPLEHVLGWVEFRELRIAVDPGVFVPRRRTEFLVTQAIRHVTPTSTVLELCCGCGAVGAALLTAAPGVALHAADIDPAAVRCARRNLPTAHGVHTGDLFSPIPEALRRTLDLVVANAPYVPTTAVATMPPEARLHEPHAALDGGADGLDLARRIAVESPRWLAPGGHLIIESSQVQAPVLATAVADSGLRPHIARSDGLDATAVIGTLD